MGKLNITLFLLFKEKILCKRNITFWREKGTDLFVVVEGKGKTLLVYVEGNELDCRSRLKVEFLPPLSDISCTECRVKRK